MTGPSLTGWKEYLEQKGISRKAEIQRTKEKECFALAALQALQQLPQGIPLEPVNERCVVWVLGVRDGIEKQQILDGGWEPLFSSIDVGWDLALMGPEMQNDVMRVKPGRRIYTYACTSHDARLPEHLQYPTFIIAFNSGIGSGVPAHMRPWVPTIAQLLTLGRPTLLTCFGAHEARLEDAMLRALQARFHPHKAGNFGLILEADKPLSDCNAMFTWVHGSALTSEQLEQHAVPYVDAQLELVDMLYFLREVDKQIVIMTDPDNLAHSGWSEMYEGRFGGPAMKKALEEDDDGRQGLQSILRCTLKSLASACKSDLPAAIIKDLGGEAVLEKFREWATSSTWTPHTWMREEVLDRVNDVYKRLSEVSHALPKVNLKDANESEAVDFSGSLRIRTSALKMYATPCTKSSVLATLSKGTVVRMRAICGLWAQVVHGRSDSQGWLLVYEHKQCNGELVTWDIKTWEPFP